MRRQGNRRGTITKLGAYKWRVIAPRIQGKPSRSRTVRGTKEDAERALAELFGISGSLVATDVTVAAFLAEWLADVKASKAISTHDSYSRAVRKHIVPVLGSIRLCELSALHVKRWSRELSAGDRTKQNAFKVLRRAMTVAVQLKLINSNPTDGLDAPRVSAHEPQPFTAEEVRAICLTLPTSHWALFVRLGFATGLRQGEMLGLQWRDLDLEKREIRVTRQVVEISGRQSVTELKTKASRRTVPIGDDIVTLLQERRRLAMTYAQAGPECHVFARPGGTLPHRSNFGQRHWRTVLKSLGLEHRGFHHARHTYASLQLSAGVPVTVISAILGHARVSTTLDIYARYLPSDLDRARDASESIFRKTSKSG